MELYEKTNLGKLLKKLRIKKKLTQSELAEMINCSRDAIGKIENGSHKPNYELLCRWIRVCGQHLILRSFETVETDIDIV